MNRIAIPLALAAVLAACQRPEATPQRAEATPAAQPATGDPAKIAEAESAAPPSIARNATIMDWPAQEGGEMRVLRRGTNNWVCYPSTPAAAGAAGADPMCLDEPFQAWAQAWMTRGTPQVPRVGIAYMLRGDIGVSNLDPFATERTPDNEWVQTGPHIMVVLPDVRQLESFPHDPAGGGPYLMWRGTPYAHIMVPVQ